MHIVRMDSPGTEFLSTQAYFIAGFYKIFHCFLGLQFQFFDPALQVADFVWYTLLFSL